MGELVLTEERFMLLDPGIHINIIDIYGVQGIKLNVLSA